MNLPFYISWSKQKDSKNIHIKSVSGIKVQTEEYGDLYDMSSISYQAHFGHNPPTIINKIKKQLDTIPMSSPKGIFPGKSETTYRLLDYMNLSHGKIFYTTGGAESVENALKISRDITQRKVVLARRNSYHGATLGALTVTGDWRNPSHVTPQDWVRRIPEPDEVDAIENTRRIILETGPENIAGIILETITGGNGVYTGNQVWWNAISNLCQEFKILLILDEVVCGFERTGKPFAYMHFNLKPDLICLAKGITGGIIPFGAVWTTEKIAQHYDEKILSCGLTNYAHPLGIAALDAVLDIVNDSTFLNNLKSCQTVFAQLLHQLKELENVTDIRCHGMLAAVDLKVTIGLENFLKNGIYLVSQTKRLIIAPPLIITTDELKVAMNRIHKTIKDYHEI